MQARSQVSQLIRQVVGEEYGENLTSWAGPGLPALFSWEGIVIRHVGSTCGGDTTLALYKLQVVAVEEGLFVPPSLRLVSGSNQHSR